MVWSSLALLFFAAFGLAHLLSRYTPIPWPSGLLIFAFFGTEAAISMGLNTGINAHNLQSLVNNVLLPLLLIPLGMQLSLHSLKSQLRTLILLSGPGFALSLLLIATVTYFTIGYPSFFTWQAALITACICSTTDPAILSTRNEQYKHLLDGESLVVDTLAVALVVALIHALLGQQEAQLFVQSLGIALFIQVLGAVSIGAVFATFAGFLLAYLPLRFSVPMMFICGLSGYFFAPEIQANPILSGLCCVLFLKQYIPTCTPSDALKKFALVINGTLIFLLGLTVNLDMFQERWLAMLAGIASVFTARFASCLILKSRPLTTQLWLDNSKGALPVMLVLGLPTSLAPWWTIQSIVYGVVCGYLLLVLPLAEYQYRAHTKKGSESSLEQQ